MNPGVLITDFSGAFRREYFLPRKDRFEVLDFTSLEGVKGYCDEASAAEISRRISHFCFPSEKWREYPVHIIDTGEYHYLSKLFTDSIDIPYTLLMIDNHTDLQEPAFGGILSCGGWLRETMLASCSLRNVILAGPEGKIVLYGRSEGVSVDVPEVFPRTVGEFSVLAEAPLTVEGMMSICTNALEDALYISIDKDVMSKESYLTDWSQGSLSLTGLMNLLEAAFRCLSAEGHIIGIDLCGGISPQHPSLTCDVAMNRHADRELSSFLLKICKCDGLRLYSDN